MKLNYVRLQHSKQSKFNWLREKKKRWWVFICGLISTAHRNLKRKNQTQGTQQNYHRRKRLTVGANVLYDHLDVKKKKNKKI